MLSARSRPNVANTRAIVPGATPSWAATSAAPARFSTLYVAPPPTVSGMASIAPRSYSTPPHAKQQSTRRHATRGATQGAVLHQRRMSVIPRKPREGWLPAEPLLERPALGGDERIVRIEDEQSLRVDEMRDGELHVREAIEVVDAVFAEMIGAHVGDDRDFGVIGRESATQDAAACRLDDGGLDAAIAQHQARAGRTRVIARWRPARGR